MAYNDMTSLLMEASLNLLQLASIYCEVICLDGEVKSDVTYNVPLLNISTFLKQQFGTCQMSCKR